MYISVYICIIKYICVSGIYLCMGWSSTGLIHDSVVFSRLLFGKTDHSRFHIGGLFLTSKLQKRKCNGK